MHGGNDDLNVWQNRKALQNKQSIRGRSQAMWISRGEGDAKFPHCHTLSTEGEGGKSVCQCGQTGVNILP